MLIGDIHMDHDFLNHHLRIIRKIICKIWRTTWPYIAVRYCCLWISIIDQPIDPRWTIIFCQLLTIYLPSFFDHHEPCLTIYEEVLINRLIMVKPLIIETNHIVIKHSQTKLLPLIHPWTINHVWPSMVAIDHAWGPALHTADGIGAMLVGQVAEAAQHQNIVGAPATGGYR